MKELTTETLRRNGIKLIEPDEVFKAIPRWNKYFISNYGRLIRKNSKGKYRIVNPSINRGQYLTYTLSKPARVYKGEKVRDRNGNIKQIRKCKSAHNLVAKVYCNNPYEPYIEFEVEDLDVHHKDGNRQNNYYRNLMYLCRNKNGRADHVFIHSIKKVAIYNREKGKYHTYNDIDMLLNRLKLDVLEFIDNLRYTDKLFTDRKWDIYTMNGYTLGIQFYKNGGFSHEKKKKNRNYA